MLIRVVQILFFLLLTIGAQMFFGLSALTQTDLHAPPGGGSWGSGNQEDFGTNIDHFKVDDRPDSRPDRFPGKLPPVFPALQLQLRIDPNPVPVGGNCTFQAIMQPAVEGYSVTYDFFLNGQRLSKPNTSNWIRFRTRDTGNFEVEAQAYVRSDPARTIRSNPVMLSVLPPERPSLPSLSIDPVYQVIRQGEPAYFQVHSLKQVQFVWHGGGQEGKGHTSSANVFRVETTNLSPGRYSIQVQGRIRLFELPPVTAELVVEPVSVPLEISIEPQNQVVVQGQSAFFTGSIRPHTGQFRLSWQGPAGQAGFGSQFTVDSSSLQPGRYPIEALVQNGRGNLPRSVAWLEVLAVVPPPLPPALQPLPPDEHNDTFPLPSWLLPLVLVGPVFLYWLIKPHPSQVVAPPPSGFEARVVHGKHVSQQLTRSKKQDGTQMVLVFDRGRQSLSEKRTSGE